MAPLKVSLTSDDEQRKYTFTVEREHSLAIRFHSKGIQYVRLTYTRMMRRTQGTPGCRDSVSRIPVVRHP